ncbi:DUF5992 family protein [Vibrio tubiashii]|uniref:DUF5992 family protein n=1 Tax=Vibrio tubiashii TaxID=29498 RepID=UPI001EFE4004|nr:DUF5992 family protein [Vibrio tubiashii]MCG9584205.1 DUF5992 family protein [Vibrio tubiashii]MCG9617800.1 DUF5992 family protein [Vibrio tubiashii]
MMKQTKCLVLFSLLFSPAFLVQAQAFLVENAVITSVSNTSSNQDNFVIWQEGGEGPCKGKDILFPRTATTSTETHKRAYAAALTAFSTGAKVDVYNYQGNGCHNAAYIRLKK